MSTNNDSTQHVQIAVADPTPLGLFGLAVVTMVASAQKLGIVEGVSWVLPWALFCGSFAQLSCWLAILTIAIAIFLAQQFSVLSAFSGLQ